MATRAFDILFKAIPVAFLVMDTRFWDSFPGLGFAGARMSDTAKLHETSGLRR